MPVNHLYFQPVDGFIHHWLVAGPQALSVQGLEATDWPSLCQAAARQQYDPDSGIHQQPVERGPLSEGTFNIGDYEGAWSYCHTSGDHFIDQSGFFPTCQYLRSWAYALLVAETEQPAFLELTCYGPADVWYYSRHLQRLEQFASGQPFTVALPLVVRKGTNPLLVRFENLASGPTPQALAVRLAITPGGEPLAGWQICLPTTIQPIDRRNELEAAFSAAYTDRTVFAQTDYFTLRWPEKLEQTAITTARLQTPGGRIYAESREKGSPGDQAVSFVAASAPAGPYDFFLLPSPREYYEFNLRVTRSLRIWGVGNHPHAETPSGNLATRRKEALAALARLPDDPHTEIARMASGRWKMVEELPLLRAIAQVQARQAGSETLLLGLLGMSHRFGENPQFPAGLAEPLRQAALDFRYWRTEPGFDALDFGRSERGLVFHACEILAGQLYPDQTFALSGLTGAEHRARGEQRALDWLAQHARFGWDAWNSPSAYAEALMALAYLGDFAERAEVWDLSVALMDKILFALALHSFKGCFGAPHAEADSLAVQSGLLDATAGITRILWGTGILGQYPAQNLALALAEKYELPFILERIATQPPEQLWHREGHRLAAAGQSEAFTEVNLASYKTPDFLLSSAQDFRPGQPGGTEHLWQATFGAAARVFVNHPGNASDSPARRPNFWAGNAIRPRLAQWKDVLIGLYNLPENDWMGYTHAYFPAYAFDETLFRTSPAGARWAFARKGAGYLALTSSTGFEFIETGLSARRELRSSGRQTVWLCQLGRAALDGDFSAFLENVLALPMSLNGLAAHFTSLRGQRLSFGWEGPFEVDGLPQPLSGFKHYENPYSVAEFPCSQMEIRYEDYLLRLDFT
jgi:hypothetical protein